MSHHLVRALIEEHGAIPICPAPHGVGGGVLADTRGKKDPSKFGHPWLDRPGTGPFPAPEHPGESRRYWCFTQVLPATEAEKEVA